MEGGMEYYKEITQALKEAMPWGISASVCIHLLPLVFLAFYIMRAPAGMATATERTLDSFLNSIYSYSFFRYRRNNSSSGSNMPKGRSLALQTVDLKVRMCCTGCERVVRNAILKLRGVDSVEINLELEKVSVTGYVDRNKVLKAVRRSGKRTEFWPNPDIPLYFTSTANYFKDTTTEYKESYNYWRHGYNGDRHGIVPVTHRGDDKVSNMFNDDNVNACCVM